MSGPVFPRRTGIPTGSVWFVARGRIYPAPDRIPEEEPAMSVTVRVPTTLRTLTGGTSEVLVEASTVREALAALDAAHPGFADRLLDDEGNLRRFVNVFVSDDDIRFLEGLDTPVPDGETVAIIPAVAGG
jgi:molybdopterin synthase sulfur carrier subunit